MNGAEILARFAESGYSLSLRGEDEIRLVGTAPPSEELRALVRENRDGLKAAILLSNPPEWLRVLLGRHAAGVVIEVRLTNPTGKVGSYPVRVSLKNVAAAVAATIGLPAIEWQQVVPEVSEAAKEWRPGDG